MEASEKRLYLLKKKGKSSALNMAFSRLGIVMVALLVQLFMLVAFFHYLSSYLHVLYGGLILFQVAIFIYLLNSDSDNSVKLVWAILFSVLPVIGVLLYAFTKFELGHRVVKRLLLRNKEAADGLIDTDSKIMEELEANDHHLLGLAKYVNSTGSYPVYKNTEVTYFPLGEDKFKCLLEELEKAERFIFMEYFIVEEGEMWGTILEILARKAQDGVEVRFMYDGFCEFSLLPSSYPKKLAELGIKCKVFSRVLPFVSTIYNFRDHRKICVIDGKVSFTGGVNLADEYINKKERFGHWKDTAVMLKGKATDSFTLMFLQMWNLEESKWDFERWLNVEQDDTHSSGYVMPYADDPLDSDRVGEMIYYDILNQARDYVHIMTPYLILDEGMETALCFAARRGVEVQIILPHIPDKKYAFALAKTHYKKLLASGVKIFEYTPGFVHAKVFVCDDKIATVGTINLDYRSFYHHFECGTYMKQVPIVADIEEDFQKTLQLSQEVTDESVKSKKLITKLSGWVLKVIAPLM